MFSSVMDAVCDLFRVRGLQSFRCNSLKALILPAGVWLNDVQLCKTLSVSGVQTISSHKTAGLRVDTEESTVDPECDGYKLTGPGFSNGGRCVW